MRSGAGAPGRFGRYQFVDSSLVATGAGVAPQASVESFLDSPASSASIRRVHSNSSHSGALADEGRGDTTSDMQSELQRGLAVLDAVVSAQKTAAAVQETEAQTAPVKRHKYVAPKASLLYM